MATIEEGEVLEFDPRELPASYRKAIGLVAAASAQTEDAVQFAIAACLGVDIEYGWAVTTHMNATMRDSVLRSVAEIRIDDLDLLDELDTILDEIRDAFDRRNNYVHNSWCMRPRTGEVFTVKQKARTRLELELVAAPIGKLKEDATFIYDVGMKLFTFCINNGLEPSEAPSARPRGHKSKASRKKRRDAEAKNAVGK